MTAVPIVALFCEECEHPREDHDENRCNARLPEHGPFAYCACKRGADE